ncbi:MAG: ornithine cyclodeaminase family protein, partial [Dehalococcoidia bacterium]|nr:ornithine cyclodeaminase family protein [Dehalococcoidia bacterium]
MPTLILTARDVTGLLAMREVIDVVEKAFSAYATGQAKMPPKAYISLDKGDFRAMPASLPGAVGLKWVSVHTGNPQTGLPTVMATLIFNDPDNGYPLAVMDATELTAYRTGAAAAIASKFMARKDSSSIGLIGAGRQAFTQLMAHAELFKLDEVRVFDSDHATADRLVKSFPQFNVRSASLEETASTDIVCTVTTAREPVLMRHHVKPGTHINAIGADAAGKEELDPSLLG